MNRLRQPGDSDYDVLGVMPGATDEEINLAFRQLIDGQGYKVGIPLNRRWLRAHQIKAAHATLADPEKRRAYDESLSQASDLAPCAMTGIDATADELILPEIAPEAAEPVENQSIPCPAVPLDPGGWALTNSEPERAPETAPEPDAEDAVGSAHDEPSPNPAPTLAEINLAFRQRIDGQGYKVGIPLNRRWLRGYQVKAAHATLADPENRLAYDESLSQASDLAPCAMTAIDAATDELILPEIAPEAAEPVEDQSFPCPAVPLDPDGWALTNSEPERAPDTALEPDPEDAVGSAHDEPPPSLAPTLEGNQPASVRRWGMAAAAAVGLGLVLLSFWPGSNRQMSTSEGTPRPIAYAEQASGTRPGSGRYSAPVPGYFNGAGTSDPETKGASPGDSPAASGAPGRSLGLQSDEGATQDAGEPATREDRPPTATTPAAVGQSSAPAEAATAPPRIPPVARGPAITAAPVWAGVSGSRVRTPPHWVGGGPTSADNRWGRYHGTVAVQVTVKPNGRVSNCAPVRGSGNAGLDAMTCRLVRKRARFSPALDARGRPVVSQTYTTFVWSSSLRN